MADASAPSDHPYRHLADHAYWRRAVARPGAFADPVAPPFLTIDRDTRVATAGSCFAQHIARHLAASGFRYLVTETAHPIVPPEAARAAHYGLFTARYGNIYTSLQLTQLIDRAYGRFAPVEDWWEAPDGGGVVDPFRPTVQPGGFASVEELRADRAWHLEKVREAFETLDLFVFTLGLTEAWVDARDGAAYPLCPGVSGGRFDPDRHRFANLRVAEVRAQMAGFVERLRAVNPAARVMLTVSPVPLAATASGNHVLAAATYSKAVLRAAAQELAEDTAGLWYFPSYEIITGPQARGRFFAEDLREVTEEGVAHVMSVFLRHAAGMEAPPRPAEVPAERPADATTAAARTLAEVMCDEAMLDALRPADMTPPAGPAAQAGERWLVVSNCQTYGLAASLAALAPDISVEAHDFLHFERLTVAEPARFGHVDRLFVVPEAAAEPALANAGLPQGIAIPAVDFTAYHPDCGAVFVDGQPLSGLIGNYWSVVLLAAYKEGLGVDEACGFFAAPTFEAAGYHAQWGPRRQVLVEQFAAAGLDIAADLPRWEAAGPFMHSPTRPKPMVLHDIARAVLRRIGHPVVEAAVPDDTLGLSSWPVYPEIAARLGVPGGYAFVPAGGGTPLGLRDYVADGLERLSSHDPAALSVIDFVRRSALKPIRALMRARLGRAA